MCMYVYIYIYTCRERDRDRYDNQKTIKSIMMMIIRIISIIIQNK